MGALCVVIDDEGFEQVNRIGKGTWRMTSQPLIFRVRMQRSTTGFLAGRRGGQTIGSTPSTRKLRTKTDGQLSRLQLPHRRGSRSKRSRLGKPMLGKQPYNRFQGALSTIAMIGFGINYSRCPSIDH